MTDDASEPASVRDARASWEGRDKRAEEAARALLADLSERFGASTAQRALASVMAEARAKRGGGRPADGNSERNALWLAIYEWLARDPRQNFASVARHIANDPSGHGRSVARIRRTLSDLVMAGGAADYRRARS